MSNDFQDIRGGNRCFNDAGLAGQTSGISTYTTTGVGANTGCEYTIGGRFYYSTDDSATATPTVDISTGEAFVPLTGTTAALGEGCVFVFCWDSGQVLRVAQGPVVKSADVANGAEAYEFPSIPDTVTPFGYQTVSYVGTTSWIFGTDVWDATTATLGTWIPCAVLPPRPLTAASA